MVTPVELDALTSIRLLLPSNPSTNAIPVMSSLVLWYLRQQPGVSRVLNSRKDGLEVSLATAELLDSCFEIVDANAREKGKRLGWKVAHILKARILS